MEDNLLNYVVILTKEDLSKENCIDKIKSLPELVIPNKWYYPDKIDYLINHSIINYNNEIVVAKVFFTYAIKYNNLYVTTNDTNYSFWAKKYIEQTITELYSIYDKFIHIINYLYDLKVIPDIDFKQNVREKLKECDKTFFKKAHSIFSRLYGDKYKNVIRDDIMHNSSSFFPKFIPTDNFEEWKFQQAISIEETFEIIVKICNILEENSNILSEKLADFFPNKGTEKYKEKAKSIQDKINERFKKSQ